MIEHVLSMHEVQISILCKFILPSDISRQLLAVHEILQVMGVLHLT